MRLLDRFRVPALSCSLAVLICAVLINPRVEMGIGDDAPYIRSAQILAATGHLVYTGWATAMIGWQLYLAALFIHVFGFSFTVVHLTSALTLAAVAFVFQRALVLAGIGERNAALGSLALALSPISLILSVTFMTDLGGVLAIVCCLYGCLFALRATTDRLCITGLAIAVVSNCVFGTSRQIAWLGVLVMVPSVLWLLRRRNRRVLMAGAALVLVGDLAVFFAIHWLNQQPFSIPEHLIPKTFSVVDSYRGLSTQFYDVPFLLLGMAALWIPMIWRARPKLRWLMMAVVVGYPLFALHHHVTGLPRLEPTAGPGSWVGTLDTHSAVNLAGAQPPFLSAGVQVVITMICLAAVLGLLAVMLAKRVTAAKSDYSELVILLGPFCVAYVLLLVPRSPELAPDRYLLGLLPFMVLAAMKLYQGRVRSAPPLLAWLGLAVTALYGIVVTHNMCSLFRARVQMADQLQAQGVPTTSVDNGWEYNFWVELQHAPAINEERVVNPAGFYQQVPAPPPLCRGLFLEKTPHISPVYAISFDPDACYGATAFSPITYHRWLAKEGKLFVVRATPPAR
jgi:hypothetical protein